MFDPAIVVLAVLVVLLLLVFITFWWKRLEGNYDPRERGAEKLDDIPPAGTEHWSTLPFGVTCHILSQTIDCEDGRWDWFVTLRWTEEDEVVEQTFFVPSGALYDSSPFLDAFAVGFKNKCIVFKQVKGFRRNFLSLKVFPCPS